MRIKLRTTGLAVAGVLAVGLVPVMARTSAEAAPFTGGNLVVYRVGDGSGPLSNAAAPVFLDELTPSGATVSSVGLPTADNGSQRALTATGQSRSEGQLTRSADGSLLTVTGYDAAPGTAGPGGASLTASSPADVARVVGLVDSAGHVDTSTALTGSSTPYVIRSAVTDSGDHLWVAGGNGGVLGTTPGASAATVVAGTDTSNLAGLTIQGGQLYVSGLVSDRLAAVGSGTPSTTAGLNDFPLAAGFGDTTGLPSNLLTSGYALLDLDPSTSYAGTGADTAYLANASERGGAVDKYTFDGSAWHRDGYLDVPGVSGLVAHRDGSSVSLAVTTPTSVLTFTDPDGPGATFGPTTPSTLATAASGTEFRGVALAPVALPDPTVAVQSPTESSSYAIGSGTIPVSVTATGATPISTVTARLAGGTPVTLAHGTGDTWTGSVPLGGNGPGAATVSITATDSSTTAHTKTVTRTVQLVLPSGTAGAGSGSWTGAPAGHSAGWSVYATRLSPNGRSLFSGKRGAATNLQFAGRSLTLTFATKKSEGIVNVVVDGQLTRLNLKSKKPGTLSRTWSFAADPLGVHSVQISVYGTRAKAKKVFLGAYSVS